MNEITLKITGKQASGDQKDVVEFVTEGNMYKKNGSLYYIYDETDFSGFKGCKTSLKVTGDIVKMKRIGDRTGVGTEMIFEKGKRFSSLYYTPYGEVEMEVLTKDIIKTLDEDGFGEITIDYNVNLKNLAEGRNLLKIEVKQ